MDEGDARDIKIMIDNVGEAAIAVSEAKRRHAEAVEQLENFLAKGKQRAPRSDKGRKRKANYEPLLDGMRL